MKVKGKLSKILGIGIPGLLTAIAAVIESIRNDKEMESMVDKCVDQKLAERDEES